MNDIITAGDSNFEKLIAENNTIIVDFWAPSCVPCKLMEPGLEHIAADYRANVKVVKVNVNENPKTISKYAIRSLPTLLFFKNGLVKTQLTGAVNPRQIERTLQEMMG